MAVGVSLCLLLILGVVVWTNKKEEEAQRKRMAQEAPVLVL